MGLKYKFTKAERIINDLSPEEREGVAEICRDIQAAQVELKTAAAGLLERCYTRCEGICCRNVEIDAVISHWDFVYILVLVPEIRPRIRECLQNERLFFPSDCVFLLNGQGPCLFPDDGRPEVCLTTFCDDTAPVRREIGYLKQAFNRLTFFIQLKKPRALLNRMSNFLKSLNEISSSN